MVGRMNDPLVKIRYDYDGGYYTVPNDAFRYDTKIPKSLFDRYKAARKVLDEIDDEIYKIVRRGTA